MEQHGKDGDLIKMPFKVWGYKPVGQGSEIGTNRDGKVSTFLIPERIPGKLRIVINNSVTYSFDEDDIKALQAVINYIGTPLDIEPSPMIERKLEAASEFPPDPPH